MSDQNKLIDAIKENSDKYWSEFKKPLLLSALPVRLESEIVNFRETLGDKSLKSFIQQTSNENKYKIIEHKKFKAKVGIIPANETYEFPDDEKMITASSKNTRDAALGFISALAVLSAEELCEINIPTYIWVKLLK